MTNSRFHRNRDLKEPIKWREEIAHIRQANRKYLSGGWRVRQEKPAHERRTERLQEILEELASLMDWRKL